MLTRLVIALVAGVVIVAALVAVLAFLISSGEPPTARPQNDGVTSIFELWFQRRRSPRTDFERTEYGAIVPVGQVRDLLLQCSQASVSGVEGSWRPTRAMIDDLEDRLPVWLERYSSFGPLDAYARQYGGIVSGGRRLIYVSLLSSVSPEQVQREVVTLCDGGDNAWGVVFDIESKAFSELRR